MKKKNLYILLASLSFAGYGWLGWNFFGGYEAASMPSLCLFKEITGLPCPSCGTTRSVLLIVNGRFWEAVQLNPLGIILGLALVIIPFWIAFDLFKGGDSFFRKYKWMEHLFAQEKWVSVSAVILLVVNWIWNISKGL